MATDKIDWIPEKRVKELKLNQNKIFEKMLYTFNLLNDMDELEAFLVLLPEDKRRKLYDHELVEEYDLLP